MKLRRIIAGASLIAILPFSSFAAFGSGEALPTYDDLKQRGEIIPIGAEINKEAHSYFSSFTGTVKEIRDFEGVEGSKFVLVEDEAGGQANMIVSTDTYYINDQEIKVGTEVTGYFETDAPMIMIYPAQYNVKLVSVDYKDQNIKADLFDENLLSRDKELLLNISEDTEMITEDGKAFEGKLENRKLVVYYGATTRSIPAQTTPTKIVVLFEKAVPPILELPDLSKVSEMEIMVNDKKVEAPAAYAKEDGTVMVPLRAIAEALKFDVIWNEADKSIFLGKRISLKIGEDYYTYMKTAPIQLGTAPELVEGDTYVPLKFFKEVASMNNAYVFEGQIVINDGEVMQ